MNEDKQYCSRLRPQTFQKDQVEQLQNQEQCDDFYEEAPQNTTRPQDSGDSIAPPELSNAEESTQLPQWNSYDDNHEVCEPTSKSEQIIQQTLPHSSVLDPSAMAIIQTMNTQMQSMQDNNKKIMSQIITNSKDKDNSTPNIPPICGDHLVEADLLRFEQLMNTFKIPQAKWPVKDYQKDQQPSQSRPSTPPRNTQNTMPRENYIITQPNPNNRNQYSRRHPQRQGTRAQPEFV